MEPLRIVIDGPAGVGKSTLARLLADELGLPYLDTGAMFRFLALKLGEEAREMSGEELRRKASAWKFSLAGKGASARLLANGEPLGEEIRSEEISRLASELGKMPEIRAILRDAQRELGKSQSLVAEGRDLGTVVFPDASAKFFLDARPEARAERRWRELAAKGQKADLAEITASIKDRDERDRNRAIAPLKPAQDAILIDTSDMTIPQVLGELLANISLPDGD